MAGRYAAKGNQTTKNLVHLKDDIIVGEWRDSTYGKNTFRVQLLFFSPGKDARIASDESRISFD